MKETNKDNRLYYIICVTYYASGMGVKISNAD